MEEEQRFRRNRYYHLRVRRWYRCYYSLSAMIEPCSSSAPPSVKNRLRVHQAPLLRGSVGTCGTAGPPMSCAICCSCVSSGGAPAGCGLNPPGPAAVGAAARTSPSSEAAPP